MTVALIAYVVAGCDRPDPPATRRTQAATLTIGVGFAPGEGVGAGLVSTARHIVLESLIAFSTEARPEPRLAESWSASDDGLMWRIQLRSNATFHDGEPLTASRVKDLLVQSLPAYMGPAFEDVKAIRAVGPSTLEFALNRPSTFLIESLDGPIQKAADPPVGAGPFKTESSIKGESELELVAHDGHYGGKPGIDRIVLRSYPSVRAAWAELLRDRVDMLYEVGAEALDSLEPSQQTNIFTFRRPYAYTIILNTNGSVLRNAAVRRALNQSIDREALIAGALRGRGMPADGAIWPLHWAYPTQAPRFLFEPRELKGLEFHCVFMEPSHERIALTVQQQLQAVGAHVVLERLSLQEGSRRLESGDFDAFLIDTANGPMVRPYWFWHSKGPYNYGRFSSRKVDAALETVQHAATEDEYRAGAAAFQTAIFEDPPAIFLAWSERARAVSTRFEVPAEPGRDILSTLRLWRPAADNPSSPN